MQLHISPFLIHNKCSLDIIIVCLYLLLNNWMLIFFISLRYEWKNRHAHCMAGYPAVLKCARRFLHSYLNETKKISSYNLISNHFHAKLKRKQCRNVAKFKFTWKRKNKLTNGHGGMIIQLRVAICEIIWNDVQIHFTSRFLQSFWIRLKLRDHPYWSQDLSFIWFFRFCA